MCGPIAPLAGHTATVDRFNLFDCLAVLTLHSTCYSYCWSKPLSASHCNRVWSGYVNWFLVQIVVFRCGVQMDTVHWIQWITAYLGPNCGRHSTPASGHHCLDTFIAFTSSLHYGQLPNGDKRRRWTLIKRAVCNWPGRPASNGQALFLKAAVDHIVRLKFAIMIHNSQLRLSISSKLNFSMKRTSLDNSRWKRIFSQVYTAKLHYPPKNAGGFETVKGFRWNCLHSEFRMNWVRAESVSIWIRGRFKSVDRLSRDRLHKQNEELARTFGDQANGAESGENAKHTAERGHQLMDDRSATKSTKSPVNHREEEARKAFGVGAWVPTL